MIKISIIFAIIAIVVLVIQACVASTNEKSEQEKYKQGEMTKEEEKEYLQKVERKKQEAINQANRKTIVKTMIVGSSTDSRKKVGSSVARGLVGGALLGPVGAIAGATTGKNKVNNTTTFLVQYKDGHKETVTVDNSSAKFNELCKYLDM